MLAISHKCWIQATNCLYVPQTTHAFTQRDKANSPLRDLALRTVQERRKRALRSYLKIQVCFLEKKKIQTFLILSLVKEAKHKPLHG